MSTVRYSKRNAPYAGVSIAALLVVGLCSVPAFADGGSGGNPNAGAGGVDGSPVDARGKNGADKTAGAGGGGGVDLTTGNGAGGGSGASATSSGSPNGPPGATGSTGRTISSVTAISTAEVGGNGAPGPAEGPGVRAGGGGGGGVGVSATADLVVTETGSVKGGNGGVPSSAPAGGGGGGVGIFSSANVTVDGGAQITGGSGGNNRGVLGGGGGGAAAIVLTGGDTVRNSGIVLGGNGGRSTLQGGGGDGGAGVLLLSGGTVINDGGTITGGNGGAGRNLPLANPPIRPGNGGAGIKGANITVVNAGTIAGGTGGPGNSGGAAGTNGQAIQFTGGVNALEIQVGSNIAGNVRAFSAADTFRLGGIVSGTFDVSEIDAGGKYDGFGHFEKTGIGTWTLTGTIGTVTPWKLRQGVLSVASDASLGATAGDLTLNGGVLQVSGNSFSSTARAIILGANGGGFDILDAGNNFTVSQALNGTGGLSKSGAGILTLTGTNSYSGDTTINQGTLLIGNGSTSGSIIGNVVNNSGLTFNRSDVVTFAGIISGTGSVLQTAGGTTILTGANSYKGGTAVGSTLIVNGDQTAATGATLVFPNATLGGSGIIGGDVTILDLATLAPGNAGGPPGTLTVNGNLLLSEASRLAYGFGQANVVGGALNDLVKVGGNLTLDGKLNVTLAPGGAFDAGIYRIAGYGGTLTDNGLDIASLPAGTPAGTVFVQTAVDRQVNLVNTTGLKLNFWDPINPPSNPGNNGRVAGGTGIWRNAVGNNNWTTQDGTVNAAWADGNFAVFQGAAGTVTVDNSGAAAVTVGGMQFADNGYVIAGDALTLAGSSGTVIRVGDGTSEGTGYTATISATLRGNSQLIKTDLGTLKLTGDSSGFTGGASVRQGMLSVDGRLGGTAEVLKGGRLQGNGTIGGLSVANGGVVAPGNSIGTLNVAGDVSFAAGSTYDVEIAGNGNGDRIAATGKAALHGGTVAVTALDAQTSYKAGQTYTILTATGGVTGGFDPAVLTRSAFLDASLIQSENAVDLKIGIKGTTPEEPGKPEEPGRGKPVFGTVANTYNQRQTAGALDTLQQSGAPLALYNTLLVLSADEARAAFDGLSGEVNASTVTGLLEDSRFVREAANDRLRSAFETVGAEPLPLMGYGDDAKAITTASVASEHYYGAWGSVFGSWGHFGGDGNAAKLSRSTGGFVAGVDGLVTDDVRFGFLTGYSHSSFKVDDRRSSASSNNYHLGIYGGTRWSALALRSGLAYTWSEIDSNRQVAFPGFSDSLTGSYRAGTTQVFGELGYSLKAGSVAFEPFANLAYVNVHSNGFAEQGGASALTARSGSNDNTFTTLGLRAATAFDIASVKATARGTIGWRHAYGDVTPQISQAFTGSSAFTIAGAPIARDAAVIEAGLDFAIAPQATLGISYHGQVGSKASDHGVRADLNVKF